MHIILGGTGHVGSAAANALLERGEPVTVVGHDEAKRAEWVARGAEFAVVDVTDSAALRRVFRTGTRAFLLNPPADPATDTEVVERRSVAAILAALSDSGLEKVVAESTYGAQPGPELGDLAILHEFEQGLAAQPVPATVQRAAYYMSNWDASLRDARDEGVVRSLYPTDFALPMVAPQDLGRCAADWLTEPTSRSGLHYVEGPARYTPADVARAFAAALGRPVAVEVVPRDKWITTFKQLGFSDKAAASFAGMTAATLAGVERPDNPVRGNVTLDDYVRALVEADG